MKEQRFERLIEAEKGRSLPRCPSNLEASVLRQVREDSGEIEVATFFSWLMELPRSGLILGSLTMAILLSTVTSLAVVSAQDRAQDPGELARSALDFKIFNEVQVVNLDY